VVSGRLDELTLSLSTLKHLFSLPILTAALHHSQAGNINHRVPGDE
jgi:hypothetical protein